jgi:hypothetical protein
LLKMRLPWGLFVKTQQSGERVGSLYRCYNRVSLHIPPVSPMSRLVPIVVLLVGGSVGGLGCTQALGPAITSASAPDQRRKPDRESTARPDSPELSAAIPAPLAHDSLQGRANERAEALEAAQVDPGVLMYMEPPSGTNMPIQVPPKNVDPEMVWPSPPSLRNHGKLGRLRAPNLDRGGGQ